MIVTIYGYNANNELVVRETSDDESVNDKIDVLITHYPELRFIVI